MPPKARGGRGGVPTGRGGPPTRGRGRGGPPPLGGTTNQDRGRSTPRGGSPAPAISSELVLVGGANIPGPNIQTIGARRPNVGRAGRQISVYTNHFSVTVPNSVIHHYNVDIGSGKQKLPARLNIELIRSLQTTVAPTIFTPKAVYDTRKNLFSVRRLPLPNGTQTFHVPLNNPLRPPTARKPRKTYKVTLTHVAEIDPEDLSRFLAGKRSYDNKVQTAITALNAVVRMDLFSPSPFNTRSFFVDRGVSAIGRDISLWRGYLQLVRPTPDRMLISIDISSVYMQKVHEGPLMHLCWEKLGRPQHSYSLALTPKKANGTLEQSKITRLARQVAGVRVQVLDDNFRPTGALRAIKQLTHRGASQLELESRKGNGMSVTQHFRATRGQSLLFPHVVCAEVGPGAFHPLERCHVTPGQLVRKKLSSEDMARRERPERPGARLASIREGLGVLQYGQSEYTRTFGVVVDEAAGPLRISARVLAPPSLVYGAGERMTPLNGTWNMRDQKLYHPATIKQWMLVIYEQPRQYSVQAATRLIRDFSLACDQAGIRVINRQPEIFYNDSKLDIVADLKKCGETVKQKSGELPTLIIAVLPRSAHNIYTKIKYFGDIQTGIATQCVMAWKTFRMDDHYWANVLLKVNVKLGGINTIPARQSVGILNDRANLVMGAHVTYLGPRGTKGPSFAALVGSVDSNTVRYVSTTHIQTARQGLIDGLEEMAKEILNSYISYRKVVEKIDDPTPARIIFYRDGVSDNQFSRILDFELPLLKAACRTVKIAPKITIITVRKERHVRIFPEKGEGGDSSGNCRAGTVIDTGIVHPSEFDFYLQSHAGQSGTSRPSHYNVLYDENNFSADELQSLTFSLCHFCAQSTRSVSVPAPLHYARNVCSRAWDHFEPGATRTVFSRKTSKTGGKAKNVKSAADMLADLKPLFKRPHPKTAKNMYFS